MRPSNTRQDGNRFAVGMFNHVSNDSLPNYSWICSNKVSEDRSLVKTIIKIGTWFFGCQLAETSKHVAYQSLNAILRGMIQCRGLTGWHMRSNMNKYC